MISKFKSERGHRDILECFIFKHSIGKSIWDTRTKIGGIVLISIGPAVGLCRWLEYNWLYLYSNDEAFLPLRTYARKVSLK